MNKNAIVIVSVIVALFASFMIVGNLPVTVEDFTGNLKIEGTLNVTGSGEFGDNVDMNLNYILYMPLESWIHVGMTAGVTDVQISSIPAGTHSQDRHYAKIHISVDTAPGADKTVSVTLTDGTDSLTVSITGAETSGASTTDAFDLDVSAETLTLQYSQTAGGSSTEACIMFHWWYKENA